MSTRRLKTRGRDARSPRPKVKPSRPARNATTARKPCCSTIGTRQIMALIREAKAEELATRDPMQAYSVRQRLDQRLSALAERIAESPRASSDDLIALALAGWYASGARLALVRTVLRAGGIDPGAPGRKVKRVGVDPGRRAGG